MTRPLAVTVRHDLGAAEAKRRIDKGFRRFAQQIGAAAEHVEKDWKDNRLSFSTLTMGEMATGCVEVEDDAVEIRIDLPDSIGLMAPRIGRRLLREGQRLLEKKSWKTFAQAANPPSEGAPRGLRGRIRALPSTRYHPCLRPIRARVVGTAGRKHPFSFVARVQAGPSKGLAPGTKRGPCAGVGV